MTKTALVLALAAMFGSGFYFGARARNPPEVHSTEFVTTLPAARVAEPQRKTPARKILAKTSARAEPVGANFADAASSAPGREPAGAPGSRENLEFASLMHQCRDLESTWNAGTFRKMTKSRHASPERAQAGEAEIETANGGLKEFARLSSYWVARDYVLVNGEPLFYQIYLNFYPVESSSADAGEEGEAEINSPRPCYSLHTYFRTGAGKWVNPYGQGGCAVDTVDQEGSPVAEVRTYDEPELGSFVSALIIPLARAGKISALSAWKDEWQAADLYFYPIEKAEFDERMAKLE